MVKKSVKKKSSSKKKKKAVVKKKAVITAKSVEVKLQPVLVENFVALQKVMVKLATKVDSLTNQVSELLSLFEMSAKALAKKDIESGKTEDSEMIMSKLDELTQQNQELKKELSEEESNINKEEKSEKQEKPEVPWSSEEKPKLPKLPKLEDISKK